MAAASSAGGTEREIRIGVEPFDAAYGAGFEAPDDSPQAVECPIVEDGGEMRAHRPPAADRPRRLGFVDGVMRVEARLTRTGAEGDAATGLAGSWAAGAVLVTGDEPARIDHVTVGRATIFAGGHKVLLPDHPDGWRWEAHSAEGDEIDAARRRLQRLMQSAEADVAERLRREDRLTVIDGPLHRIRRGGMPVIGYVKTHHRRMLARAQWIRTPELSVGERSGLFMMGGGELYGCYLRIGDPGPWAGPWAGIVRIEIPAGVGRDAAVETVDLAAGWLPAFASALHRDARAPVNLTPVAGLERRLRHLQGDPRLALRAVREAVLRLNREERAA